MPACKCVLSNDFLLSVNQLHHYNFSQRCCFVLAFFQWSTHSFVNQWHHSIVDLKYCFCEDSQCFRHSRLEFRMPPWPPCRCVLNKDVFCLKTSGTISILINDAAVSFLYLQCFRRSRYEVRMPACKCVLSNDFLLTVNQWLVQF